MTEEPRASVSTALFQEIKTLPPDRTYKYRSLAGLTYAALALVGVDLLSVFAQIAAIAARRGLLLQIQNHGFASQEAMATAAQNSDSLVKGVAVLSLMTLVPAYVISAFWIYNAACNIRAIGARGMQISPGWAVGWFAVPIASLAMPFQGIQEIYLASRSPIGWKRLPTPLLLRLWWAAWLVAGLGGYLLSLMSRAMRTLPEVITANQLLLLDVIVSLIAGVLFLIIVWRVYRAQAINHSQVGQVAQVFA